MAHHIFRRGALGGDPLEVYDLFRYQLDDGSGTVAADLTGNSDGTYSGAVAFDQVTSPPGFDGNVRMSGSTIQMDTNATMDFSSDWTMTFVIAITAGANSAIIGAGTTAPYAAFGIWSTGWRLAINDGSNTIYNAIFTDYGVPAKDGSWYAVTFRQSGATLDMVVNGVKSTANATAGAGDATLITGNIIANLWSNGGLGTVTGDYAFIGASASALTDAEIIASHLGVP